MAAQTTAEALAADFAAAIARGEPCYAAGAAAGAQLPAADERRGRAGGHGERSRSQLHFE